MTFTDFVVKNFWNVTNGITVLSALNFPINVVNLALLLAIRYNISYIKDAAIVDYFLLLGVILFAVWGIGFTYKKYMWEKMNSHVNMNNPELMEVVEWVREQRGK